MRRIGPIAVLSAAALAAALLLPASASAALTNVYGMKYSGQDICTSCHDVSYGATTHGRFAQVGADPSADHMWPVGRAGLGLTLNRSQVAFTLGAGTGEREYLVNNVTTPVPVNLVNIQGVDRYATAVLVSQAGFASASSVVIARADAFPDALGAAALAGAVNGPILLIHTDTVPAAVMTEISRLGASDIYVLGSSLAISTNAANQLATLGTVIRVAGSDRYGTSNAVAQKVIQLLGPAFSGKAFMATGSKYPDALACAPVAFKRGMPILLADPAANSYTLPAGVTSVQILGSTLAVSDVVEQMLVTDLGRSNVGRLQGGTRYATAAAIAGYGVAQGQTWDYVGVATGQNFPDALSGAALIGVKNSVMLLTPTGSLDASAAAALTANKGSILNAYFIHGDPPLAQSTRDAVSAILTPHASGVDPFVVPTLVWDPIAPDTWEIDPAGIALESYTCQGCHQLGAVAAGKKPTVGNFVASSTTSTVNAWVTDSNNPAGSPDKYVAGSSIQCEVCHGTGTPGGGPGNHFGVFNNYVRNIKGVQLLDSQVCGQCHGRYKAGSTVGYTPDQNLLTFITPYGASDVPTSGSWNGGTNVSTGKAWNFFPNGENKALKHSYYQEWTLSAHSYRGALPAQSASASVFQKAGHGHYAAKSSSYDCAKCHTGEAYAKRKNLTLMKDISLTTGTVGYYGQECADCHVPHGAGTDNGMGIRTPDTSVTLAGITMTSICEDCHNWQLEMQGLSIPTTFSTPAKDLTARGGFSHPTREIYNGRGMYEIPAADKFMPGVKCEQCHMPATRSDYPDKTGLGRYDDRSYKRYSHRMFIMQPGEAQQWGLAPWGDSCSPCHAGQTQDSLQAYIEKWQDDAADAATEASAAYAAAYARAPGSSDGTNTAAFKALMGPACYNYRNYLGEGSLGAHNPDYIVAGLEKAVQLAKSLTGSFAYVVPDGSAFPGTSFVAGTVHNGDGSGAAGATIVITVNGVPNSVVTDANGNFSFLYPSASTVSSIVWKRCSNPAADLAYPLP